ncbi:hypothetical protein E2C01_066479 [Portunus trituberculatus]|uniref:Uncharacterized protein n=1 Tax=Portunus trituberculatus TaxID=210409 RepID=A0A5B7HLM0_PORTR|nr:hypothetical protein [Portunus trituberculatus]
MRPGSDGSGRCGSGKQLGPQQIILAGGGSGKGWVRGTRGRNVMHSTRYEIVSSKDVSTKPRLLCHYSTRHYTVNSANALSVMTLFPSAVILFHI